MRDLPPLLKIVTAWLVLGTLVFLGAQALQSRRERPAVQVISGMVELQRAADGHYHWPGSVAGRPVVFLVDTGASMTTIPVNLARSANLPRVGSAAFDTANGRTINAIVVGDVALDGGVQLSGLRMGVLPAGTDQALLGMDVIGRLGMSLEDGVMRLHVPQR